MAAPTPVSSLVHSSTLVTAGVYLLLRNIIHISSFANMDLLFFIGGITIMMARISAINEKDMKKMVALSTLRQLGLIIIRVGLRSFAIAFMHLIIHAFFKAIMFIATGNLIHTRQSYQSVKNTGRIRIRSPINRSIIIIASIRLIGLPFIASFFSKEPIIELRMVGRRSLLINIFSILGVLITCIYSYRFVILVIGTSRNLLRPR
jgi:NADH-ubiquinone oxidoreductase chain 5